MASAELAGDLAQFAIVKDVDDGFQPGKTQFDFQVRPEARSLGLTAWVAVVIAACGLLSFSFVKNLKTLKDVSNSFSSSPIMQGDITTDTLTMERFRQAIVIRLNVKRPINIATFLFRTPLPAACIYPASCSWSSQAHIKTHKPKLFDRCCQNAVEVRIHTIYRIENIFYDPISQLEIPAILDGFIRVNSKFIIHPEFIPA